ncbi:MAG: PD-(D/E)XK nuclease family protein [Firmicutes bacterium]|nr:PD-(D/E)XK nuclease family protein [Bacillota bacterium]
MLEAIIGRAGSGKTELLISRITAACELDPLGPPIWYVVPDHVTFAMEERLTRAMRGHALLRVQVVSLRRLARSVLNQLGEGERMPLKEAGKYALLAAVCEQTPFLSLGQAGWPPHLLERLLKWIEECQRHLVTPAQLRLANDALSDHPELRMKMADLAQILDAYSQMAAGAWMDSLELLPVFATCLDRSSLLKGAAVYFDGFVSFSPQEWQVIEALGLVAREVAVTVAAPSLYADESVRHRASASLLSHPFAEAIDMLARLSQISDSLGMPEPMITAVPDDECPRFAQSPVLAHLERALYTSASAWNAQSHEESDGRDAQLYLASATTAESEVAGTVRALIRHRRAGVKWRALAIIVPHLDDYRSLLEEALSEAGIPYYMDVRISIERHPLSVFIFSALGLAVAKSDEKALWGLLKSDLFPATRLTMDTLENEYLQGRWRPFARQDGQSAKSGRVDGLLTSLLQPFFEIVREGASVREMATALWSLLERAEVAKRLDYFAYKDEQAGRLLDARTHERAYTAVLSTLDELVEVFGDKILPLDVFAKALRSAIGSVAIGAIPATIDQVLITETARIRAIEADHVYALGCADGSFPARMSEDDLLADSERSVLAQVGVKLAEPSAKRQLYERYRVYLALTRARQSLTLSCPAADATGRGVTPSMLLSHIQSLFAPGVVHEIAYADGLTGTEADQQLLVTPARAAHWLAQAVVQSQRDGQLPSLWHDVYEAFAQGRLPRAHALSALAGIRHSVPEPYLSPKMAQALYGDELLGSVSRLERYASCAFAHFGQYGLRLRERERLYVDAARRGSLAHDALRYFVSAVSSQESVDWGELTDEAVTEFAKVAFARALADPRAASFHISARARQEASQVYQAFERAVLALTEHARRSAFRPVLTEVGFGRPQDALAPLVIALEDGRSVRLRGQIDRVDVAVDGTRRFYRIIDYKSADKQVRLDWTYQGLELQLALYARVVEQLDHPLLTGEHEWAGLFYFPVRDGIERVATPTPVREAPIVMRKRLRMRGLVRKEARVVELLDRRSPQGETDLLAKMLVKGGGFDKRALAASKPQWEALSAWVQACVRDDATQIFAGDIRVSPYRKGKTKTACAVCSFQALCRFEPATSVGSYRVLPAIKATRVWDLLGVSQEEDER